jgi:hypothetical protein
MAFKMKGNPYKMGGHKTKSTMAYMKSPLEQAKPDYPDIDKDGNTTESMKKAAADKKRSPVKDIKEVPKASENINENQMAIEHNKRHKEGKDHEDLTKSTYKFPGKSSPAKKYKSHAQRKAVHASKADKSSPTKKYKKK